MRGRHSTRASKAGARAKQAGVDRHCFMPVATGSKPGGGDAILAHESGLSPGILPHSVLAVQGRFGMAGWRLAGLAGRTTEFFREAKAPVFRFFLSFRCLLSVFTEGRRKDSNRSNSFSKSPANPIV